METLRERGAEEDIEVGVDLLKRRSIHKNHHTLTPDTSSEATDDDSDGGDSAHKRNSLNADSCNGSVIDDEAHVTEMEEKVESEDSDNATLTETRKGAEYRNGSSAMEYYPLFQTGYGGHQKGLLEKHSINPSSRDTPTGDESKQIGGTIISVHGHDGVRVAISNGGTKLGGDGVVNEDVRELPIGELDVERVIADQETHDLFCPNCRSCITKRVILRRRKRKHQEVSSVEEVDEDEILNIPPPETYNEDREMVIGGSSDSRPSPENERDDTGPEVFRCLSCFSIFIPTGNGFKFWRFGDRQTKQNIQSPQRVPAPGANEVSSENASTTTNAAVRQDAGIDQVKNDLQGGLLPPQDAQASIPQEGQPGYQSNYSATVNAVPSKATKPVEESTPLPVQEPPLIAIQTDGTNVAGNIAFTGQDGGLKLAIHLSDGAAVTNKSEPKTEVNELNLGKPDDSMGKDVIIAMPEEPVQVAISVTMPQPDNTTPLLQPEPALIAATAEDVEFADRIPGADIMKAIVYGGLVETITSLSVVTSAVGADTSTLNILALGVANVIGGLFFLAHNLRVLKRETSIERYEEQLGRIGHFPVHAIIAVISYLVFGLMSPIVYCCSFRKSDNRDLKLITLGSSALLSVVLLAVGKAHVRRPQKYMKTLVYYVSLGIMVSGVSLVVGDLIQVLMEKLGWFNSNYPFTLSASEVASTVASWAAS